MNLWISLSSLFNNFNCSFHPCIYLTLVCKYACLIKLLSKDLASFFHFQTIWLNWNLVKWNDMALWLVIRIFTFWPQSPFNKRTYIYSKVIWIENHIFDLNFKGLLNFAAIFEIWGSHCSTFAHSWQLHDRFTLVEIYKFCCCFQLFLLIFVEKVLIGLKMRAKIL